MYYKQFFAILGLLVSISSFGQFLRVEVEEIPNNGEVPGSTYRVYAVMDRESDVVDAIFADQNNKIEITSTKPFYQHPKGGALASDVQRYDLQSYPKLKYDSWFTIGKEDNYQNFAMNFQLDSLSLKEFEQGGNFSSKDGAWFVTPDKRQVLADEKGRVLLMQLTTEGTVKGLINLHGRTRAYTDENGDIISGGEIVEVRGVEFTCP